MNRMLFSLLSAITTTLSSVITIWAAEADTVIPNPISEAFKDVPTALGTLSKILIPVATLGLFAMLTYAGFTRMTAAGDAEKEKKSMQILQAAILGFLIIACSGVIMGVVAAILGIQLVNV